MRSFRFVLRGCLTTSFRWANTAPEAPRGRGKPCSETSFRTSFASAPSGNGTLVTKQRPPACASLRPRSNARTASCRISPPRQHPTEPGGQSAVRRIPQESNPHHPSEPHQLPHPGALQKQKIPRHRRNDVSRQHTVPGGGLEPPRSCEHWHLKPARLPIPPPGRAT